MSSLSGATAIVGIGATEFSKASGRSELQLGCEAVTAAIAAFTSRTNASEPASVRSARSIGSISSDVDRNTPTSVPSVITRPAYSVAAIAENPHCGTMPSSAPTTGPAAPARRTAALTRSPAACSSASSAR